MKWVAFTALLFYNLAMGSTILAFAGSARSDSVNKKLIREAVAIAEKQGHTVILIDLQDYPMPLYNGDLEAREGQPKNATAIRKMMLESDTIIISTPEYNSSLPALLKNTIDWASRGEKGGSSLTPFKEKRFILLSASPGKRGGARALAHLKTVLENIGGVVTPRSFSLPDAYNAFDASGHLKDPAELTAVIQGELPPIRK